MTTPLEVLEAQVLSLSQADRSRLVDKLLTSLSHGTEWEQAWAGEADRRVAIRGDDGAQYERLFAATGQYVEGNNRCIRRDHDNHADAAVEGAEHLPPRDVPAPLHVPLAWRPG